MYEPQKKYLKTDKGKVALKKYRDRPENKANQKIYQKNYADGYKVRRNDMARLNYYYKTDPLPCSWKLYREGGISCNS